MKKFVEKLIERLEEYEKGRLEMCDWQGQSAVSDAIVIVKDMAEEYNNGWISVEDRLPELTEGTECFKQSPCCFVTLKWFDGDITESVGWYNQSGVWSDDSGNCKVIAWKPIEHYKPKGE